MRERNWIYFRYLEIRTYFLFFLLFSFVFLIAADVRANSVYKLGKNDILITAEGISLAGIGEFIENRMVPPDRESIMTLPGEKDKINSIDRFATDLWSKDAQKASNVLLLSSFFLPFSIFASEEGSKQIQQIIGMYFEAFLLSFGINKFTKVVVQRYRPYMYNDDEKIPLSLKESVDSKESFYSGHTAVTFTFAILTAKLFSDLGIAPQYDDWVWGGAILLGSIVGLLRVIGGMHFPTDVVTGGVIGGAIGYFIPEFHKVKFANNIELYLSFDRIIVGYEF